MMPAACLLLALLAPIVMQETPQRVERITEIHWCQEKESFVLRQVQYLRIGRYTTRHDESALDLYEVPRPEAPRETSGP